MDKFIKWVCAACGYLIGAVWGGLDGVLFTLLALMVVDYITGVMAAIKEKKLSSETGFVGICRKVYIFLLVGVANVIDIYVIGKGAALRTGVAFFYIANEGISILENGIRLGLTVPEKLRKVLEQINKEE